LDKGFELFFEGGLVLVLPPNGRGVGDVTADRLQPVRLPELVVQEPEAKGLKIHVANVD